MQINFYECAPWANTVEMPASLQIRLLFPGETSFSSLFPGIASPADLSRLNLAIEYIRADESASGVAGYPNFSLFSGETATMSAFHVGGGSVNHPAGATMKITGEVVVGNDRYYNYDYIYPCHYYLQGGSLIVGDFLELGAYGKGVTRFVHDGGDVTVTGARVEFLNFTNIVTDTWQPFLTATGAATGDFASDNLFGAYRRKKDGSSYALAHLTGLMIIFR